MITRYWVNCFERELCIEWDDAYKHLEKEILDMLDGYYFEWHSVEEIEDPEYRAYVEDSCCEEFMMTRLSETYNMWDSWWVEGDEDENGNEMPTYKTHNHGYIAYSRALELLNNTINYCSDNGNVELAVVRRDLDAIGFTNEELKWLGYHWLVEDM
jgi:hypothetical protein|nr:MAG TPA: hypothetical protein [Caudoviricetes sp.]